jgi:hypothetical protein
MYCFWCFLFGERYKIYLLIYLRIIYNSNIMLMFFVHNFLIIEPPNMAMDIFVNFFANKKFKSWSLGEGINDFQGIKLWQLKWKLTFCAFRLSARWFWWYILLKFETITGTGSAMTNTPLREQTLPTILPGIVFGTMSP